MGIRYQKRVGGTKDFGLNFSGSGVSSSYRTKYGTFGSKGFSIKSGIPGLSFRSSYGRGKDKGVTALIILGLIVSSFVLYYSAVILYNFTLFIFWSFSEIRKLILRKYFIWKEKKEIQKIEYYTENEI